MWSSLRVWFVAFVVALCVPIGAAGQELSGGFRISRASNAQPGTIEGIVFDAATGRPLPGAQVYSEGGEIGALSDTAGRFRLEGLPDRVVLRADLIGYASVESERMETPAGLVVQVGMAEAAVPICERWGALPFDAASEGVLVFAHDIGTGEAPKRAVMLRVRMDGNARQASARLDEEGRMAVVAGGREVFDAQAVAVEVLGDGYTPWQEVLNGPRPADQCPPWRTEPLHVWLVPIN